MKQNQNPNHDGSFASFFSDVESDAKAPQFPIRKTTRTRNISETQIITRHISHDPPHPQPAHQPPARACCNVRATQVRQSDPQESHYQPWLTSEIFAYDVAPSAPPWTNYNVHESSLALSPFARANLRTLSHVCLGRRRLARKTASASACFAAGRHSVAAFVNTGATKTDRAVSRQLRRSPILVSPWAAPLAPVAPAVPVAKWGVDLGRISGLVNRGGGGELGGGMEARCDPHSKVREDQSMSGPDAVTLAAAVAAIGALAALVCFLAGPGSIFSKL
jgi:hypothetical protein